MTCSDGICKVTSCDRDTRFDEDEHRTKTYHPYYNTCEEDSIINCGSHDVSCSNDQFCAAGCCAPFGYLDIITFGQYEQDGDTQNGKEPIAWKVIGTNCSNQSTQILVLSEKVLDKQPFNSNHETDSHGYPITWNDSTIRSWLNGYDASYNSVGNDYTSENFIDTAFTAEEKAMIVPSDINGLSHFNDLSDEQKATIIEYYGGESVALASFKPDKIFLLNREEACKYSVSIRATDATDYAITMGIQIVAGDRHTYHEDDGYHTRCVTEHCTAAWWLRTSGKVDNTVLVASSVSANDKFCTENYGTYTSEDRVDEGKAGVRPAMWIQY